MLLLEILFTLKKIRNDFNYSDTLSLMTPGFAFPQNWRFFCGKKIKCKHKKKILLVKKSYVLRRILRAKLYNI